MFIGMLVGATAYEKRTMYIGEYFTYPRSNLTRMETVDDGTGVIQCVHFHPSSAQDKQKSKQHAEPASESVPDAPKPLYEIGDILRVTGRAETWRDSRQVIVNEIGAITT